MKDAQKPLAIDLYAGLGGWTEGLLAAGCNVVGFDIERHEYGDSKYPAQLVLQDILTVHGSQFRSAALIVASPPCQAYSWLAMPWSRSEDPENSKAAKALRNKWETEGPDNRLFDACFRIQREAQQARCEALKWRRIGCCGDVGCCRSCHIPLIVENVRGAQPWVGRSRANYGSFHLWGSVEMIGNRIQAGVDIGKFGAGLKVPGRAAKVGNYEGHGSWKVEGKAAGQKTLGHVNQRDGYDHTRHLTNQSESDAVREPDGRKIGGDWFSDPNPTCRKHGSRSNARKAASAMIAKIPLPLAEYIGRAFLPGNSQKSNV